MTQKVTGREGEMEGEETSSRSIKTEPEAEGYIWKTRIVSCLNTGKITTCVAIKDPLLKTTPDEMRKDEGYRPSHSLSQNFVSENKNNNNDYNSNDSHCRPSISVLSFLTQGIKGRSSGEKMSSDDEQYKSQKFLMHKIPRVLLKVSLAAYFLPPVETSTRISMTDSIMTRNWKTQGVKSETG